MAKLLIAVLAVSLLVIYTGCAMGTEARDNQSGTTYRQISSEEAQKEMESSSGYVILDVRTQQEYEEGHIPMAICIPNESIDREPPMLLPNKEQTIYVYCRSGRRSKEAAQKLFNMGYKNIVEFGGINAWHGKVSRD